ncbi:hypothetical protein N7501_009203 [Penicillium viridicatum]|nr:hypothetical protein N7501_009203 [Penicillium viridicatum]
MAETLAGQVAQLTEQHKKTNSQSATNPVHSSGCWQPAPCRPSQVHRSIRPGTMASCALGFRRGSASAARGEVAFLKSGSGPQGSQPTIPKAISTPVPPRQEVTRPAFLSRNKLHALRDTGHSNQQPPEGVAPGTYCNYCRRGRQRRQTL